MLWSFNEFSQLIFREMCEDQSGELILFVDIGTKTVQDEVNPVFWLAPQANLSLWDLQIIQRLVWH